MEYTFHPHNSLAPLGMAQILRRNLQGRIPVIACVGSDLSIGDSLGPLVGSMIKQQCAALFVYGTLANPVTAKEVVYLREFIAETHPHSPVVAVDAAVGAKDEVGLIRIGGQGILPGSGSEVTVPDVCEELGGLEVTSFNLMEMVPDEVQAIRLGTNISYLGEEETNLDNGCPNLRNYAQHVTRFEVPAANRTYWSDDEGNIYLGGREAPLHWPGRGNSE